MVKIVFCLRRKAGLSSAEFQAYWRKQHAPLVRERVKLLGIRRYVQCHTLFDERLRGLANQRGFAGEEFDGVAELWFDQASVLYPNDNAPAASIEAARELLRDEGNFIDLENSPIFVTEELEVFPGPDAAN
ncbi:EthD domain-containing protein [Novosphingobium sp.]|uniref:EthD domain-containing protein n=1 Tax=Novosphingobium sp. TaxID=1874826 RepID=UPI0038B95E4A